VLPRGRSRLWHHALMDYGSAVATAKAARAAGAPGARPQPAFAGSLRQARGQVVRRLLADTPGCRGPADSADSVWRSARWLAEEVGLTADVVAAALAGLVADGVVSRDADGRYALATG
jgi:hypothetical protein